MGSTHKKLGKMADNNEKKSKVFSNLVKLIQMEAKKAGGNTSSPGLKAAIEKARKKTRYDNIERAIKKHLKVVQTSSRSCSKPTARVGLVSSSLL
ncbi:MAG: hypothetical protein R3B55_00545 [Candidatus Paceibacterota bacterium]